MTLHEIALRGAQLCQAAALPLLLASAGSAGAGQIEVAGTTFTYVEEGTGPVVLFLHGAVSDRRIWEGIRARAAESHRFVAYDQRYFGTADWPDDANEFSVSTHADDLAAVIDKIGAGPVHLVTWSYGGLVGLHAAMRHPEKFRSIVHFEPTIESLHSGLSGERAAIAEKFASFGPMAEALQRGAEAEAVRRLIEAVFRLEAGAADDFPANVQQMWDDNARTLLPLLDAIAATVPVTCEDLSSLDVPTLVIQGSDAYVLDAMMSDEVARCQPHATAVVLDGANHGGPVQKPDAFIEAVLSFVDSAE